MAGGRVADRDALRLLEGIAAGLDYAHELNLVHRDVKPANVLLGHRDLPVLADFGLVKLIEESAMTASGTTTGTPQYMAPEQVGGPGSEEVGPAADRYALAAVAYELLTGHLPFEAEGLMKLLYAKLHTDPPPASSHRADLSPQVDAVLARGLARDPAARWESSADFVSALREALAVPAPAAASAPAPVEARVEAPKVAPAPDPAPVAPGPRRIRSRAVAPALVAMLAIAAVAIAGVVSLRLLKPGSPSQPAAAARSTPSTPSSTPSIVSTPPPNLVPARGTLRHDYTVFSDPSITSKGTWTEGVSTVTFSSASIDLAVVQDVTGGATEAGPGQDQGAGLLFNSVVTICCQSALTSGRYVADWRLTYDGGAAFLWQLNFSSCCTLILDTSKKVIRVVGPQGDIVPAANVSGIQPGQVITLAVVSDPPHYSVFIGDTQAANLTDPTNSSNPAFTFKAFGHVGTIHLTEFRVYNLPGS
jgi:hypothetical protein